jgi:hypothetical protein
MFAVERTANIKGNSPQFQEIVFGGRDNKTGDIKCPKGLGLFLFGL